MAFVVLPVTSGVKYAEVGQWNTTVGMIGNQVQATEAILLIVQREAVLIVGSRHGHLNRDGQGPWPSHASNVDSL